MKLCIITPSFSGGGAERIAVNLANHYSALGMEVCLIAFKGEGPYKSQVRSSVRVIDLKVKRTRYVWLKLRRTLLEQSPTHILSVLRDANIFVGLVMLARRGTRVVFREANTMHGIENQAWLRRSLFKMMMRASYFRADLVIANSHDTKADLLVNKISHKEKIRVIGNPVIDSDFKTKVLSEVKHPWVNNPGVKLVLNVGRLHPHKNQKELISAFSFVLQNIPEAKLIILGEGAEHDSLISHIRHLGVENSIEILGFQENPFPYYRDASLFVLSSNWEGFGNVIVEALASGTPVVSTDCPGGPRTILDHGKYGSLVPLGDVEEMAAEIERSLRDPARWDMESLKNRGEDFTVSSVAKTYLSAIDPAYSPLVPPRPPLSS